MNQCLNDGSAGSNRFVWNEFFFLLLLECGNRRRSFALSLDPKLNVNHSETFEKKMWSVSADGPKLDRETDNLKDEMPVGASDDANDGKRSIRGHEQ